MSKPVSNINYYEQQQCSVQWRAFLNAFSVEFSAQGDANDLRTFMYKLGVTMAASFKVDGGETLLTLESGINKVWADLDWGWVQLRDESDCLLIEHNASPLKVAFGEQALDWSPALLEGVYSYWFESMGIDKSLRLSQRGAVVDDGLLIVFQLKKQVEEQAYFTRR